MRSFEQRIAEIQRRSEKILLARKKRRKHVLLACIPLVLCIGVYTVCVLPAMAPARDTAPESITEAPLKDAAMGSLVCSYEKVQIQSLETTSTYGHTIADRVAITKIYSAILDIYPEGGDALSPEKGNNGTATGGRGEVVYGQPSGYRITFTTADGTTDVYVLQEDTLTKLRTGEAAALTQTQQQQLYALLGIAP